MRRILITGASGGLGQALVQAFLKDPVRLGLHCFQNLGSGKTMLKTLESQNGDARIFTADLRKPEAVNEMFHTIQTEWGGIDVLINNAAINQNQLFHKLTVEEWENQLRLNLSGAFYCVRAAGEMMQNEEKGHIINIASFAAFTGRIGQSAYTASKRGLIALAQTAAKELGKENIQINTVCPGFLPTPMTATLSTEQQDRLIAENTLGRASTLDEVSEFIRMLSKMNHVSGQVFNLDSRIL